MHARTHTHTHTHTQLLRMCNNSFNLVIIITPHYNTCSTLFLDIRIYAKIKYFATLSQSISTNQKSLEFTECCYQAKVCKSHWFYLYCCYEFTSSDDIVNLFNDHFSALFRSLPPAYSAELNFSAPSTFCFVPVTAQDVLDTLQSLNVNKATEPDGISVRLLRLSASVVMDSLAALFNESLQSGIFPSDWKKANVYPVFKAGDSQLLTNYRPISVLHSIAKVFETIVHRQVFSYFSSNGLFTPAQSGFRPGHSTQDLLLKVTEDWRCALDNDDLTGAVFIDLNRAFDSIDHAVLLAKLSAYGFDKPVLHWFTDYLLGRQQRVVLGGSFSDWATVVRGVPQGSVLGPLLFSIYIMTFPKLCIILKFCLQMILLFIVQMLMFC